MIRMTTLILSVFLLIFSSIALADSSGRRGGQGGHNNNQHGYQHGNKHGNDRRAKNYGYRGHRSSYRSHGYARHGYGHRSYGYQGYLQPYGYYGQSFVRLGYYSPGLDIVYQSRPYGPGYNGYVH